MGHRRDLLGHTEVPECSAGAGAGDVWPAGRGGAQKAEDEGAELVSGSDDDPELLGERSVLSPYGADQHELCAAGGARDGGLEGLEARIARHGLNGRALQAGLAGLDLSLATAEGHRLPQLTCVRIPEGIDDLTVRKRLLKEWGIEIGGGLGPFKGKAWRIGLMGYSSRRENVTLVLSALETCLRDLGHPVPAGTAVSAAAEVYGEPVGARA